MVPVRAAGVPSDLLGSWARVGLTLVSREAGQAGLGGAAKHRVWSVCPQLGSKATAAWVVQRQGQREGGAGEQSEPALEDEQRGETEEEDVPRGDPSAAASAAPVTTHSASREVMPCDGRLKSYFPALA